MRVSQWNLLARGGHRRVPELLAALTLAAACATGAALPAAAATIPGPAVNFAPHGAPAKLATLSTGPATVVKNAVSTNWAGYASTATPQYYQVSASWNEPRVTCGSADSYASFWVGLDGYNSASVEQTGTLVYCHRGVAHRYAWYEMYPAAPVYYNVPVAAGDRMTATVDSTPDGNFELILGSSTRGWIRVTDATNPALARASAEVVAEAPSSTTGVLPLADFHAVTFQNGSFNNGALVMENPINVEMAGGSTVKALCGPIDSSGGGFICNWHHA